MKYIPRITLLFWLFAVTAPSIITLCDVDNPIVVTNINEEEQQETGKKNQAEEKIVNGHTSDFSLIANSKKLVMGHYCLTDYIDYTSEILLPPPEYNI